VKLPPDRGEGQHWQTKPGNPMSAPIKVHLDPATSGVVKVVMDKKVPPIEQEQAEVDSVDDWYKVSEVQRDDDNKWVKHLNLQSDSLSKLWGRPTYLSAIVLLPDGFDEHPEAHYPVILEQDHFHRHFAAGSQFRTTPPNEKLNTDKPEEKGEFLRQ